MAKYDFKRAAARQSGRPLLPEYSVVAGANTATNIAVTGISREDGLIAVIREVAGVTTSDLVGETSITSSGNIQLTTTNTTGNVLTVIWVKVRPGGS